MRFAELDVDRDAKRLKGAVARRLTIALAMARARRSSP